MFCFCSLRMYERCNILIIVKRLKNIPTDLSVITPCEGICLCITVSTLD